MKFKGIEASTFASLVVTQSGQRQIAEKIYNDYGVLPGTSRALYEDTKTYKPYKRKMQFLVKDSSDMKLVSTWLDGSGDLAVEPGGFYKARVLSIDLEEIRPCGWSLIDIEFEIQPFFWLDSGKVVRTMTVAGVMNNVGNLPAEPIIKIYGSGNITLNVGAKAYQLTGVSEYLTIDSERRIVYKETINEGKKLVGGFPVLMPGNNNISWTGAVTKAEILGNWIEL